MNKKSLLKLLVPIALIIVMAGALPLFTGCMPGQQEIAPPPEVLIPPEQPSEGVASISVDKKVKVEGGDTWEEEVEQCVCQNVEFQVIVSNDGDVPLINILVSDLIPAGLDYNSGSAVPSPTPDPPSPLNNPVWFPGPLAPNTSIEITFSAHVASEGEHENWVNVQAETDDGVVVSDKDWAVVVGTICECVPKMHYPQYPDVDGWDVYSCLFLEVYGPEAKQVADDWNCTEPGPISHIRFWGSWKDDVVGQITGFHIEIYSNIPEDGDYSHPGDLLWDAFITNYSSEAFELAAFEGWYNPWTGFHEDFDHNTYYQYDITDIQDAFYQEEGNIYWLSIWPEVSDGFWGWKSSQDHWMDDACWSVHIPGAPAGDWGEIYEPTAGLVSESLDLAFVICGGEAPCQCEGWEAVAVSWTDESGISQSWDGSCGGWVSPAPTICSGTSIEVTTGITCEPSPPCGPSYEWEVTEVGVGSITQGSWSGSTLSVSFTPTAIGLSIFEVVVNASCDGTPCPPCIINMRVNVVPCEECDCRKWESVTISSGDWEKVVNCGETINTPLDVGAWVEVTASYICTPPEYCVAKYKWDVAPLGIDGWCYSSPCEFDFELPDECVEVNISAFCDDTLCERCTFTICPEEPCECGKWEKITISAGVWEEAVNCDETINRPLDGGGVVVSANYICIPPEDCKTTYKWVVDPLNIDGTCYSSPCVFDFELHEECVRVNISVFCDDILCDECPFKICPYIIWGK